MQCINCGKEAKLYDYLCEKCFREKTKLITVPKDLKVERCVHCGKVRVKKWTREIKKEIPGFVKFHPEASKRSVKVEVKAGKAHVRVEGRIKGLNFKELVVIQLKFKPTTCARCSRIAGGYHEAIVQVRGVPQVEKVTYLVDKILKLRDVFLIKASRVKNGMDYYIERRSGGEAVAKAIAERFGCRIKSSRKLAGVKEGKKVFRVTYLVKSV